MPYGHPLHMCDNLRSFEDKMKIKQFFKDLSKFTLQLRYLFVAIWNGEIVFHEDGQIGCRNIAIGIKSEPTFDDSVIDAEIVRTNEQRSTSEPVSRSELERRAIDRPVAAIGQDA